MLDKKYRPNTFDEVRGNDALVASLKTVVARPETIPSSFLLTGPSGCGKTTIARILAKEIGATKYSIYQYNNADYRGIETAREINQKVKFFPMEGEKKVYILNECHQGTAAFFNALLETLEEPPKTCHFILCTTEPGKLIRTVRTRCATYSVSSLTSRELKSLVEDVCAMEGVNPRNKKRGILQIAKFSEGCPRQALILLESVIGLPNEEDWLEAVRDFSQRTTTVVDLFRGIMAGANWPQIAPILKTMEGEPEPIRKALLTMAEREMLKPEFDMRAFDIIDILSSPIYERAVLTSRLFKIIVT
jgi:DNA polymerase-3 subunit gamma/tau